MVKKDKRLSGEKVGEETGRVAGAVVGAKATGGAGTLVGAEVGRQVGREAGKQTEKMIRERANPLTPMQYDVLVHEVANDLYAMIEDRKLPSEILDLDLSFDNYIWGSIDTISSHTDTQKVTELIFDHIDVFLSNSGIKDYPDNWKEQYEMYSEILFYGKHPPNPFYKEDGFEAFEYIQDMALQVILKDAIDLIR